MPRPRKSPFRIGLTGSIGMGKTETAKMFARLGLPVYDADAAVHALYDKGGAAVPALAKAFPEAVREGRIDRETLAARVADDAAAFDRLEAIVHPLVAKRREAFIEKAERDGAEFVVLDIPLLFEKGGEKNVDAVVVVSAPEEVQTKRVLSRPGMTAARWHAIRARQVPDSEKRAKADFVVDTGKGFEHAFAQVEEIVAQLRKRRDLKD